jgi:hypothetical protein
MPRRKKKAVELPLSEALPKMFPKAVRDKMKETAVQSQKKPSGDKSK